MIALILETSTTVSAFYPVPHPRDAVYQEEDSPRAVLPDEERRRNQHATEEEAFAEDLTEGRPEAGPDGGAVVFDLYVNLVHLVNEVGFLRREIADEAQVLDGLVATVPRDQPPGRLFDEEGDAGEEHSTGD